MEVAINHVIAIAEKIENGGPWRFIRPWVHKNNSVLFDKKTEATIFISNTTKFKTAVVAIFIKESLVQQIAIKAHFLRISGYDIASRLEIVGKETITDEEIRTNYITLPHFVTLKDEIMRTLQK
jgi:hypothetical protein